MHPLAEQLAHQLEGQEHWRSLMVDGHLLVKGTDCIFALGDTATIEQARCFQPSWVEAGGSGEFRHHCDAHTTGVMQSLIKALMWITQSSISAMVQPCAAGSKHWGLFAEVRNLCLAVQEKVLRHAEELFEEGDTNHDGKLTSTELQALLIKVDPACSFFPLAHIPA